MTDTNLARISLARKTALGAAPPSRFRTLRARSNGLVPNYAFVNSTEMRADRMKFDPKKVGESVQGQITVDWRFAHDSSPLEELLESAFCADFVKTPARDNDGVADSQITDTSTTTHNVTVAAGPAFVTGHLCLFSGFAVAGNNGLFRCTSGSATTPNFASQIAGNESSPPAAARIKVVGFQGAAGDIIATATGLASTLLNFTTLGLQVGQWIKTGGAEGAAFAFNTAALNGWARITAISANALTLDHRPAGWTTDAGTGKTIRVFFGDVVKNGTSLNVVAVENSFLGQATPVHVLMNDVAVNQFTLNFQNAQMIEAQFACVGASVSSGTTANGSTYDAAQTNEAMTANGDVLGIYEGGALLGSPNWVQSLSITLNNNMRVVPGVGNIGPVRFGLGSCEVTGQLSSYFGSNALLTKLINTTRTSIMALTQAAHPGGTGRQAMIVSVPRVTFSGNGPEVPGENQDVVAQLTLTASIDALTNCHIQHDEFEYFS